MFLGPDPPGFPRTAGASRNSTVSNPGRRREIGSSRRAEVPAASRRVGLSVRVRAQRQSARRPVASSAKRADLEPRSGDPMLPDVDYRRLVLAMRPTPDRETGRRLPIRESLDTLVLGSLSTSIGLVLLIALFAGIAQRPIPEWNEKAISSASYYIPSKVCAIVAIAGECLGLAGVLVARYRHRTISPLSTLGTGLSLIHVYLFFLHVWIMELR